MPETYSLPEIGLVWRPVYGPSVLPDGQPHTHATYRIHRTAGAQRVDVAHLDATVSRFVCSFAVPEHETVRRKGRVPRSGLRSSLYRETWDGTSTYTPGCLSVFPFSPTARLDTRIAYRPRPAPPGAAVLHDGALRGVVDRMTFVAHRGGNAFARLDDRGAFVVGSHDTARAVRFDPPLPGLDGGAFVAKPADVAAFGRFARLVHEREGRDVALSIGDVGLPGLPTLRLRLDAPSGAWAVLDASPEPSRFAGGLSRWAGMVDDVLPRTRAVVLLDGPPRALVPTVNVVLDVHGGHAFVARGDRKTRPRRIARADGAARVVLDVEALRDAFVAVGPGACRLLVAGERDPVLVSSADGTRTVLVLPCLPRAD